MRTLAAHGDDSKNIHRKAFLVEFVWCVYVFKFLPTNTYLKNTIYFFL